MISSIVAVGQSIHILFNNKDVTNTTITSPIAKGESAVVDLSLLNTTDNQIIYKVSRTILNPPFEDCASLYFCTGKQCYAPSSSINWTGPYLDTINAHETLPYDTTRTGLQAHYDVCPDQCHDLKVLYRVYSVAQNAKDTAFITIIYSCATGIAEEKTALGSLSDAYPNPSSNGISVNYALHTSGKNELVVYDLSGKKMIVATLEKMEGSVYLNTSTLRSGVYFYSLLVNGQRAITKQLVVE